MTYNIQTFFKILASKKATTWHLRKILEQGYLYVDIWFDVTKYKFIEKNSSFKLLVVFLPIFLADAKITFVYNFVAPLKETRNSYFCVIPKNQALHESASFFLK